jgi:hypothetical protein
MALESSKEHERVDGMTRTTHLGTASPQGGREANALWARLLAGVLALAVMSVLVLTGSRAAFTDTSVNAGNTWETGVISLTNDREPSSIMFAVGDMQPGQSDVRCIAVTYTGPYTADVGLYATVGGSLAPFLTIGVEMGQGGSGSQDCEADFTGASLVSTTTLSAFGAYDSWTNAIEAFSAPTGTTTRTFRFTVTLPADAGNDAQGKSASATFTWEAHTT